MDFQTATQTAPGERRVLLATLVICVLTLVAARAGGQEGRERQDARPASGAGERAGDQAGERAGEQAREQARENVGAGHRVWITGRAALDVPAGRPAAGAVVGLRLEETADARERRLLEGAPPTAPVVEARADPRGGFALLAPGPGPWTLTVDHPGRVPMERRILPVPAEQELPPVTLRAGTREEVRWLDPAGRPGAGAWFEVVASSLDDGEGGWRRVRTAGFADDGGVLEVVRADAERLVVELANAWGRERRTLGAAGAPIGEPSARWERVALLSLQVVDRRGAPVPGALLKVDGVPWTLTDGEGRAALPAPPAVRVEAIGPEGGWSAVDTGTLDPEWFGDGDVTDDPRLHPVVLVLEAERRTRIRVRSSVGERLGGAWVLERGGETGAGRWARTGDDGELTVRSPLPAGPVEVGAVGHRWSRLVLPPAGAGAAPGEVVQEVVLAATAMAEGFVVDAAGRAVSGAELVARPSRRERRAAGEDRPAGEEHAAGGASWARSRADGSFRLRDLEPRVLYDLAAGHPELPSAVERFGAPAPRATRSDLRVVLRAPRRVTGVVVSALDQQPVAGAMVWIEGLEGGVPGAPVVVTGADGVFSWDDVPDGAAFDLHAVAEGFAPLRRAEVRTPIDRPGDLDLGLLRLQPGETLTVRVRDAEGSALEGAAVAVDVGLPLRPALGVRVAEERRGPSWTRRTTDRWGEALFRELASGSRLIVHVSHPDHVSVQIDEVAVPRESALEVALQRSARIEGSVSDEDGRPLAGVFVAAFPQGPPILTADVLRAHTDADGRYRIGGVPAGRHRVEARPLDQAEIEPVELTAVAGERHRVDFRVPPSARVEGRVRDARGDPLVDARVVAAGRLARTDELGEFVLERVRLGEHRFEIRHRDGGTVTRRVWVADDAWLDFELGSGAGIAGVVTDAEGRPVPGVALRALALGASGSGGAVSEHDGRFRFADLEPGPYRVEVADRRIRPLDEAVEVTVAEESIRELRIRVELGSTLLRGRIVGLPADRGGDAVMVTAEGAGTAHRAAARPDGSFELAGLVAGSYVVEARTRVASRAAPGSAGREPVYRGRAEVVIAPDDREVFVDVELDPEEADGVRLTGRLTVDGGAAGGVYLLLTGPGGTAWVSVNAVGELEGSASPGLHHLVAAALDTTLTRVETLELRHDLHLELELYRAEIEGRIVEATSGLPIEGAEIFVLGERAHPPLASERSAVTSGAGGAFRLSALVERGALLWVRRDGGPPSALPIGPGVWTGLEVALGPAP